MTGQPLPRRKPKVHVSIRKGYGQGQPLIMPSGRNVQMIAVRVIENGEGRFDVARDCYVSVAEVNHAVKWWRLHGKKWDTRQWFE